MGILTVDGEHFLMDGEKTTIISGTIHYFRVIPEYWEDRLKKLKACGFNTVETYTCWNLHERREGMFDFTGGLDIGKFLDIAKGMTFFFRPVSVTNRTINMETVDLASSRLHESTSNHSSCAMMRCMARFWKSANSYLA